MKISDLIKKLETIKEKHGDNELSFSVKDSFHNGRGGGEPMCIQLTLFDDWFGIHSCNGLTRLDFNLKQQDGKNPKITYRK